MQVEGLRQRVILEIGHLGRVDGVQRENLGVDDPKAVIFSQVLHSLEPFVRETSAGLFPLTKLGHSFALQASLFYHHNTKK